MLEYAETEGLMSCNVKEGIEKVKNDFLSFFIHNYYSFSSCEHISP